MLKPAAEHSPRCSSRISSAVLPVDKRTTSAMARAAGMSD